MSLSPSMKHAVRRCLVAVSVLVAMLWSTQPNVSTQGTLSLPFSKHFLVTGNYAVGSVDFLPVSQGNGQVTGTINMSGVPANAEILAAYLYWETISSNTSQNDGATFRGKEVEAVKKTPVLLNPSLSPCWTGGGQGQNVYTMTAYRADVLRLLPRQLDSYGLPTGPILVNSADLGSLGPHTVTMPERGTGNVVPVTAGATLFVIFATSRSH